jgi:hypothetical protein
MENSTFWDMALQSHRLSASFLLGLFFNPEDGGDMFLRNFV